MTSLLFVWQGSLVKLEFRRRLCAVWSHSCGPSVGFEIL